MAALSIRAKAAVIRALYALPKPVRRLMAGPPVRIDGQEQALDAQFIIRLKNLSGSDIFADPVEKSRSSGTNRPSLSPHGRSSSPPSTATFRGLCTRPRTCRSRPGCWCITTAAASRSARD
jgi:hypothetical protein